MPREVRDCFLDGRIQSTPAILAFSGSADDFVEMYSRLALASKRGRGTSTE